MALKTPAEPAAALEQFTQARDAGRPVELVRGEIIEKAAPSAAHGAVQAKLGALLDLYARRPGPDDWWILKDFEIAYPGTNEIFRHDLCGFRRELHPARPTMPVRQRPEWVCELLSTATARVDLVQKQRTLHAHGVEHYWIVDPEAETLAVFRHEPDGYLLALASTSGETVRAEPFDGFDIAVGQLFGRDER